MKIAIAMQEGLTPNSSSDDWLLQEALKIKGVDVDLINWRDKTINLAQYDSIFVSSTWNVPQCADEFMSWIAQCESGRKRLINDADVLKLSLHKDKYLTFLLDKFGDSDSLKGSITPSAFIMCGESRISFTQKCTELKKNNALWGGDIVIKPIISADGHDTYRLTHNEKLLNEDRISCRPFSDAESLLTELLAKEKSKGVILQPFMPYVEQSGEYQLVYINNQFSHATVKPKGFKKSACSQRRYLSVGELPPGMLDFGDRIMHFYNKSYPYGITRARFDFFSGEHGPILCEAEMVEPNTNIKRLPAEQQSLVVDNYAAAIVKRTEQLQVLALIKEVLGDGEHNYLAMLQRADMRKAVMNMYSTYKNILAHLADDKTKHNLAIVHSARYFRSCFDALTSFATIEAPNQRDKKLLIQSVDNAQQAYAHGVLSKDQSPSSKAVRLILMAVVNFIAALTLGLAHYLHYQATGRVLFFAETASERQLRQIHQELNNQIERLSLG